MESVKFSQKLTVCFLAGLVGAAVFRRVAAKYFVPWMPLSLIWAVTLVFLLACIIYVFIWHRREKHGKGRPASTMAFFQGLIMCAIAFDLSSFGWQKICHLQMRVLLGILDLPFSSLSGEDLTWAYFGRSYPYTVAIAISQIAGAYLLLFRKTRLLALILLIPILLNIIMIDAFYRLPPRVLIHAIILFAGVIYLLLQAYGSLIHFFFRTSHLALPVAIKRGVRNMLRISVVAVPLILLATYDYPDKNPQLKGKYSVSNLKINNRAMEARSVKDSVLTTVYMDSGNDFVLEFNHFNSRYIGTYHYYPEKDSITVTWRYPRAFNEDFSGKLKAAGRPGSFLFRGQMNGNPLEMELVRVPAQY